MLLFLEVRKRLSGIRERVSAVMGLKVIHLIDSGGLYGAEKMLLNLVQEQLKQGLSPMILSAGEPHIDEKPLEHEARRLGLPVMRWRMKPGVNLKESWKIIRWAQTNRYDLLHSHGFKFNVLLGCYPEWLRQIPMIATLHGYVHAPRFSKLWIYQCLDRLAIRRIQGVVLVADAMKKEFSRWLVPKHLEVIPNGLNIFELQKLSTFELGEPFRSFINSHRPLVIGVGRLSEEKGFDRLVRAFAEATDNFPNAGLIIVGEGALRCRIQSLIEQLGLIDDVILPGYCNNVYSLLKCSSVLVMPSKTEGLPITLLEAMSLKTPIIASSVGEIPKVLGNGFGGKLLNNIEPPTISRALVDCLTEDEESLKRADWSYVAVQNDYSSHTMADGYIRFYEKVCKGSPRIYRQHT